MYVWLVTIEYNVPMDLGDGEELVELTHCVPFSSFETAKNGIETMIDGDLFWCLDTPLDPNTHYSEVCRFEDLKHRGFSVTGADVCRVALDDLNGKRWHIAAVMDEIKVIE